MRHSPFWNFNWSKRLLPPCYLNFMNVTSYCLVEVYRRFRQYCISFHQNVADVMRETIRFSEILPHGVTPPGPARDMWASRRPLRPIFFNFFGPRTGMAKPFWGGLSKFEKVFEEILLHVENLSLLAWYFQLFQRRLSTPYCLAPRAAARLARPLDQPYTPQKATLLLRLTKNQSLAKIVTF
jgi:hypothetical protein